MMIDWVMWLSTTKRGTGILWTFTKQLEDLYFTDDIALLSHKHQDAELEITRFNSL
jgi:hypothetical protein